jgi:uncharacterized heparinase superfamily protein
MNWSTFVTRGRKAMRMPPRVLAARLRDEVRQQTKRPWASVYPRVLGDRTVLGAATSFDGWWAARLESGTFFLRPSDRARWIDVLNARYPHEASRIVAVAETVLRHEFDLLGSGPVAVGASLPWHHDFKTGREWPLQFCKDIEYLELDRPTDVKVPWELSRAQHFPVLGQAYWLTGDERYAREFVQEVDDWINRNPLAYGVNWACAMDVALRAVNWMWGFYFMGASQACASDAFRRRFVRSLYTHGEFVSRNLETSDINGNHYLSDAVGLVFMGVLFRDTDGGSRWLDAGESILTREVAAQIYEDGVDHEASTPYHRLVLELFMTGFLLLEASGRRIPRDAWLRIERMLDFVAAYTKPNGLAPLVGDADDGRVQKLGGQDINDHRYLLSTCASRFSRADHKAAAGRFWEESFWTLGPEGAAAFDALPSTSDQAVSTAFPHGGYYILRNASTHLFIDCAEVGMRGRGGHGHNDILSFELFMNGANIVTDCGAYVYTASREWRNRFRSTAFHNTMQVDGEELNRFIEPNALWQLHDDARPVDVRWRLDAPGGFWRGSHSGYQRLPQPCTPSRSILMDPSRPLVAFRDDVAGEGRHRVSWRWHLDPACEAEILDGDCRIKTGSTAVWMLPAGENASLALESGWVSKSYGVKSPATVIVLEMDAPLPVSFAYLFAEARLDRGARADIIGALAAAGAQQG